MRSIMLTFLPIRPTQDEQDTNEKVSTSSTVKECTSIKITSSSFPAQSCPVLERHKMRGRDRVGCYKVSRSIMYET